MPFKEWNTGDVLIASAVNTFVMNQQIMVFDDAAARTTALPVPVEGMVSYLKDTNALEFYTGTTWRFV